MSDESLNELQQNRPVRKMQRIYLKQKVWNILIESKDSPKNKLMNIIFVTYKTYPFRFSDILIIMGILGISGMVITLSKNLLYDSYRTTHKYDKIKVWGPSIPYQYIREEREPL